MNTLIQKTIEDLTDQQWAKIYGHRAGQRGQDHTDNPYIPKSILYNIWYNAWREGNNIDYTK